MIPPPTADEKPIEETKEKESELMQKNTEPATEVNPKDKDIDEVSREEVDSLAAMSLARAVNDFRSYKNPSVVTGEMVNKCWNLMREYPGNTQCG